MKEKRNKEKIERVEKEGIGRREKIPINRTL